MKQQADPPILVNTHAHTHRQAHTRTDSDTGIRFFWSEATDYNMFIALQANCRALIKHTRKHTRTHTNRVFLRCLWTAEFLLKIDLQAVVCRCFAEEFITALQCTAVARAHACTYRHTWKARTVQTLSVPTSNLDLPSKATPFHLEYLRCKQTNAPLGEGVRQAERKRWRQTDQNRHRMRRGRSKQASRWCEVDEEEDTMTGTQPARNGKEQNTFLIRLFFDGSCFKGKFACVWWYKRLSLHFTPSSRFFCGFSSPSLTALLSIFSNPLLWQIIAPSFFIIFFSPSLSPSQSALCQLLLSSPRSSIA